MKKFRELSEAKGQIVFAFGRFNPPTTGHEKLIAKVASVAGGDFRIYPSHSQGPKDPLPHALKIAYMRKMFKKYAKNIIADKDAKTAINIAVKLYDEGYTDLVMVAGSDRLKEFDTLLNKYNDVKARHGYYNFSSIRVVSAGERDPDAEGVEGMSASKMRAAAQSGDFDSFKMGIPNTLNDRDKMKLYQDVRKYMGVREVKEDLDMRDDYDALRDAYLRGEWGNIGDIVEANGFSGEVVRRGTNYLSFVDEDGKFHKAFLHQVGEDAWWSSKITTKLGGKLQQKTAPRSFEKMAKQYADLAKKPEFKGRPNMAADAIARQYKGVNTRTLIAYINDLVMQGKLPKELRANYLPSFAEAVKQDKDIKDREGTQPSKYYSGIGKDTKDDRARHFEKGAKKDDNDPSAYKPAPGDATAKTKPSQYTQKMKKKFPDLYDEKHTVSEALTMVVKDGKKKYQLGSGQKIKMFGKEYDSVGVTKQQVYVVKGSDGERVFSKKEFESLLKKGDVEITDFGFIAQFESRNYRLEYDRYHSRPEQIERRSSRNKARRIMGDKAEKGMDIGHKDNNPLNNDPDNLRNEDPSTNRREPRLRESAADASLRKKAEKTGISFSILKQVYKRGVAAWRTGHRPGTTPEQWGHARVNSFATGGKTRTTADADLWKQHKGKSESVDLGESWKPSTMSGYSALMFAKEFPEHEVKGAFQYHPDVLEALEDADEGLWDNIRKKRERIKSGSGERMRKKGEKGAPTPDQIQKAQEEVCCDDCATESVLIENNQYRVGSEAYFEYFNDMRKMYNEGRLEVTGFDKELMEGDLGKFATYEEQVVPLDCPMMEEEEPELNKPKAGGPKKYYVYVRDPATGNVKKVTWGDTTGLKVKLDDPEARKSFAARHKCDQQKDKTKAAYWACNLPRYASQLGLSGGGNFFW